MVWSFSVFQKLTANDQDSTNVYHPFNPRNGNLHAMTHRAKPGTHGEIGKRSAFPALLRLSMHMVHSARTVAASAKVIASFSTFKASFGYYPFLTSMRAMPVSTSYHVPVSFALRQNVFRLRTATRKNPEVKGDKHISPDLSAALVLTCCAEKDSRRLV